MRRLEHKEEVERLMQRFIDGISTLEEEAQLAEFFRTHEVTGKWCAYKEVFALFDEGKVEPPFSTEEKPEAMSGKKRRWGEICRYSSCSHSAHCCGGNPSASDE